MATKKSKNRKEDFDYKEQVKLLEEIFESTLEPKYSITSTQAGDEFNVEASSEAEAVALILSLYNNFGMGAEDLVVEKRD